MASDAAPVPASSDRSSAAAALGERVRARRLALGLSQEALAELTAMHWTFVGQVERGRRNVTLHNLVRLADALGVDPGVLVTGIGIDQVPACNRRSADRSRSGRPAPPRELNPVVEPRSTNKAPYLARGDGASSTPPGT